MNKKWFVGILIAAAAMAPVACDDNGGTSGDPATATSLESGGPTATTDQVNAQTPAAETTVTDSGIEITDTVVGDGDEATAESTVTVHYTVYLEDGTKVQSSKDTGQPYTNALANLIPGWQEGIPGMKVGGTRKLVIPPELAYGDQPYGDIPANSTLTFEIELIAVQ